MKKTGMILKMMLLMLVLSIITMIIKRKTINFKISHLLMVEKDLSAELSKFTSIEHLRDLLETSLRRRKIMKAYPILKDFVSFLSNSQIF